MSTYAPEDIERFRLFSAHDCFNNFNCIPEPRRVFTVFREPIDRFISQYQYWRSYSSAFIEANNHDSLRKVKTSDIKAYLNCANGIDFQSIDNRMTRLLSHPSSNLAGEPWRDDEEILEAALGNLEKMDAFGIFEFLPESIDLIYQTLDIAHPKHIDKHNVTRENHITNPDVFDPLEQLTIDEETEELLVYRSRLDTILYNTAKAKFLSKIGTNLKRSFMGNNVIGELVHHYHYSAIHGSAHESGFLLFGPYITLKKGTYTVTVEVGLDGTIIDIPDDTALAYIDVCSAFGNVIHGIRPVLLRDLKPGLYSTLDLVFTLEKTAIELEIRVFTHGICPLSVYQKTTLGTL